VVSRSASELLRFEAGRAPFAGWTLLEITGRHRERYLHSQLTSDVRSLEVGTGQLSALLDATGRLQSFFFLHKLPDAIRLLVPSEVADHTIARLRALVIADDVAIERLEVGEMTLALGPAAVEHAGRLPADLLVPVEGWGARGFVGWGGEPPTFAEVDADELEARRVLSGIPRWGVEASAGMLVNETALLALAVSFDKGCYLGQETVAKVASRRGAAVAPVLLRLDRELESPQALTGTPFAVGDRERAGTVWSWARWEGSSYLQVSASRELRVDGLTVTCRFGDGRELGATVVELPLLRAPSPQAVAEGLLLRATARFADDREGEAITLLERAIAVAPGYADAYETLGVVLGRHRRFEEAIAVMRRLLEVDPDSVMAHTNMSVYHNQLGRTDEAEAEARAAAVKAMARQRREKGRVDEERQQREREAADRSRREEMFRQVLAIDAEDALANFGLGQLKVEAGAHVEAVPLLERALATDPGHSAAYLALGRAWEGLGDDDRAREVYSNGVRVAARRGDLKTAAAMHERLGRLDQPGG
jgi:folate-binding protein YgfZ